MRLFFAAVVALVSTAAASANANGLTVANLLKLPNYTGTVWDWSIVAAVCLSSILIFWMARVIGRLLLGRKLGQRPERASQAEIEEPRDDRRI
jgi:hypothetical protein